MSTSNSSESRNGEQHMQQALFKGDGNADNSSANELDPVAVTGELNAGTKNSAQVSLKSDAKISSLVHRSSKADTPLDAETGLTSSSLLLAQTQQQSSSQQFSGKPNEVLSKPGLSEGFADRLPEVVANLGETKPIIKPRPIGGAEGSIRIASESNDGATNSGAATTAARTSTNSARPTKVSERISATNSTTAKGKGAARRRGKWTVEEEEYVARVIQDFNSGFLNAPAGYTLRSYLSDKLQCDPMRITKKFTGESCIGKRVFHPAVRSAANAAAIDKAQAELDALERRWRRRLELQQRESAKKAAASAAAANAASRGTVTVQGVPVSMLGSSSHNSADSQLQQSAVTQAASWLDRANVILMGNIGNENQSHSSSRGNSSNEISLQQNKDETTSTHSSMEDSLEHQMKEVQRLIYEGPMIQQTTAGLPNLLLRTSDHHKTQIVDNTIIAASTIGPARMSSSANVSPTLEPADKRMRINATTDSNSSGAEDAEALVGFLRSVRASAAAGQEL